ncbi:MAG: DUF938 domain-containing protein [Pseudomonadota bacterium]
MSLPFSPSSERNKRPIARALLALLPQQARVLEIGSGTGQHAEFFLAQRPDLQWTATEMTDRLVDLERRLGGLAAPVRVQLLEIGSDAWPTGPFEAVFTANTLHIMPWSRTPVLIEQAAASLEFGGRLYCYGPFADAGRHNSDGNWRFDRSLRSEDPAMGIRDLTDLRRLGAAWSLPMIGVISMPANNRLLVFERC